MRPVRNAPARACEAADRIVMVFTYLITESETQGADAPHAGRRSDPD
jgi:hypothetical protein